VTSACSVRVRGVVQGVGFRPFVFSLARRNTLAGWVLNAGEGVQIHLEGAAESLRAFLRALEGAAPPAAVITEVEVTNATPQGLHEFVIRDSLGDAAPSVRISPDLPVCGDCLRELFDRGDRRYGYPYINCTNCGPRYSVIVALPYDRPNTTMGEWPLDDACRGEYEDPDDRRFHAQPVACADCGPGYFLKTTDGVLAGSAPSIPRAAELLREGAIVAIKGVGGYHLGCDARNLSAVAALRARKFRKEKPFAVMVENLESAREIVRLTPDAEALLTSRARPIVLAPALTTLEGVAPDRRELGVMLPYAPLHHLLFARGAPGVLVMTSANRSSEPVCYEDDDAFTALSGIADAFLVGQRAIARRVDDSVARDGTFGPVILRRSRGYSPGVVANLPTDKAILAVGADLKNTVTLVVDGQAIVSQHVGDLEHQGARAAFERTIVDLVSMYRLDWDRMLVVHDNHPHYASTEIARGLPAAAPLAVQHHRAHVASVLAEHRVWDRSVIGVSLDGTGYGDDGVVWGGEFFVGSLESGVERVGHLRTAALIGGDQAARYPVQAAAGFLAQVDGLPDLMAPPFNFPARYRQSLSLLAGNLRVFETTSMGRLFDAAAALLGFTREMTYEGQAAMWLEDLAAAAGRAEPYDFPFDAGELDFRPLLEAVAMDRKKGRERAEIARAFHEGVARGVCHAASELAAREGIDTVAVSGGVFQNELLCAAIKRVLANSRLRVLANHRVPCNDGGISLGQAAVASVVAEKALR
jgi:hydrogenase maturation protein HypF